jgi:hypothetical protein
MSACGDCSLCCKLMILLDPGFEKPENQWCKHCKPGHGGCMVYDDRPHQCREYQCGWLQSQQSAHPMEPMLKPSRSKVIFMMSQYALLAVVDPGYRGAERAWPVRQFIESIDFPVLVMCGSHRYVHDPKGRETLESLAAKVRGV